LALPSTNSKPTPRSAAIARSSVDLPVSGGPSMTAWRPASIAASTSSSSRWRPTTRSATRDSAELDISSSVVDEHAADVLAVAHVGVAVVDTIERVRLRDEAVEVELAVVVQLQQLGDVGAG